MTVLLDRRAPDGFEALVIWLTAIGESRANRPPGAVFPYYMVTRPSVVNDQITETGIYRVHSFAVETGGDSALYGAYKASMLADSRVLALAPRFGPQQPVTMSSGLVVYSDGVSTKLGPTHEKFTEDGSIERFVADYEIGWRLLAVT